MKLLHSPHRLSFANSLKRRGSRFACRCAILSAGIAALLVNQSAPAATLYWDTNGAAAGSGAATGLWNGSTAFWTTDSTGATIPAVSLTTSLDNLFIAAGTNGSAGTITVSGAQSANSLTFDDNVAITISGGVSITLGGGGGANSGISVVSGDNAANTVSTGIILGASTSAFAFTNAGTSLLTVGAITGAATSGTQTLTLSSTSTGGITVNGIIADGSAGGNAGLTINDTGSGVTTLTAANTYTGATTINAGTLNLGGGAASGSISSSSALVLGGGTLSYTRTGGATQTFNGAAFTAGASFINNTVSGDTLNLGAIAQTAGSGATVNFTTTGTITTTTANTNGILGGWATVGNAVSSNSTGDWAANDGSGHVITYTGYTLVSGSTTGVGASTQNWKNSAAATVVTLTASATINSLVMQGDFSVANGTTLTLASGGLMMHGISRWLTDNGGGNIGTAAITSGLASGELFVHTPDAGTDGNNWRIWPIVTNNGTTAVMLIKDGPGYVMLQNSNTYTGGTIVNGGTLAIGGTAATNSSGLGTGTVTVNSSGMLRLGANATSNVNVATIANNVLLAGGTIFEDDAFQHLTGTLNVTAASTLGSTYNGGAGDTNKGLFIDGIVSGSGNLTLQQSGYNTGNTYNTSMVHFTNGGNTYSGTITVTPFILGGSYLGLDASATLANATLNLSGNNTGNQQFGTSPLVFKTGLGTATIGALTGSANVVLTGYNESTHVSGGDAIALTVGGNGGATTYSGIMSGVGSLTKSGSGVFTLAGANTYTGATNINGGTLQISALNNLGAGTFLTFNAGTLDVSSAGFDLARAITLNGAAVVQVDSGALTESSSITNGANLLTVTGSGNTTISGVVGNGAGGLTKTGSGTLTLSGSDTYTGATMVSGGVILLSGSGSVNSGSGISISGSGAKLVQTSSTALTPSITLTQGTLDGIGTVGAVTVGNGTGGIVANGNGGTTALTIGSLTFNGAATATESLSGTSAGLVVTGGLITTGSNGLVTINLTNTAGWVNGSTYNLISYGIFSGALVDFAKGSISGLGARQSATLGNSGSAITLAIAGDTPVWTGVVGSNWTTTAQGAPFNWKLQSAGTGTEFLANDQVLFDDSATGSTAVNISDANVSPAGVIFNNSSKSYTLSSSGGFGVSSGSLVKNGTAALTINTTNSYSGGTTLNAGVLDINNASAIGTGTLTIAGGAIDNTSGSAITLSTNNAQIWNGDFTFAGSNSLNLGTGAVTLGASRTITTNGSGVLTVGGAISGSGFALTKAGAGTLILTGANSYSGATTINAGILQIGNGTTDGSLSSTASIVNSGSLVFNLAGSQSYANIISGVGTLTKSGAGTLTLSGPNSYNGGTTLNAGALNINNPSALGTGMLTIVGGAVDNTSGATITLSTNNAQSWSGDFGFTGSNSLNLGTGAVTLSASRVVTAAASTRVLTVPGAIGDGGSGFSLTKAGTGTVALNATNTYSGGTIISAGILAEGSSPGYAAFGVNGMNFTVNAVPLNTASFGSGAITVNTGGVLGLGFSPSNVAYNSGAYTTANAITLNGGALYVLDGQRILSGTLTIGAAGGTIGDTYGADHNKGIWINGVLAGTGTLSNAFSNYTNASASFVGSSVFITGASNTFSGTLNVNGLVNGTNNVFNQGGSYVWLASSNAISSATLNLGAVGNSGSGTQFGGSALLFTAGVTSYTVSGLTGSGGLTLTNRNYTNSAGVAVTGGGVAVTLSAGNNDASSAYSGVATGLGGITKIGAGTLTLSGTNTYTGATTVSAGTLNLSGSLANTAITIAGSANLNETNAGVISGAASITHNSSATTTLAGANTYTGGTTINTGILAAGSNTAFGSGVVTLNGGALSANGIPALTNNVVINPVSGNILNVPTGSSLTLNGNLSGAGTVTKTGPNSLSLGGDNSAFSGTISTSVGSTYLASASAGSINATWDVASGAILGNNVAGTVSIDLGGLTGAGVVGSNSGFGALTFSIGGNNASTTFSGVIKDDVADLPGETTGVTKVGAGALTLSNANTYSGATTVASGTVVVSGSIGGTNGGTAGVTIASGAILATGTTGTITTAAGGDIAVSGTLAPGNLEIAGTLTLALGTGAKLDFLSGSTFHFDLNSTASTSDTVAFSTVDDWLSGSGNATLTLNSIGAGINYSQTYTLFSNVSTTGFTFASISGYDRADYTASVSQSGNNYQLTFQAVPEPGPGTCFIGSLGVLVLFQRRRSPSRR